MRFSTWCVILLLALCCVAAEENQDATSALATMEGWIKALPFPESEEVTQDLTTLKLLHEPAVRAAGGSFAHAKPPWLKMREEDLISNIGAMLRRGVNLFRKGVAALLPGVKPTSLTFFMSRVRAVLSSYNDFYIQLLNTLKLGPEQVEEQERWAEYGPETNFWLKFRPYLTCSQISRLGPEYGGIKIWCNPKYFQNHPPKAFLSGGSGGDFAFEDVMLSSFSESTAVTLDCFFSREAVVAGGRDMSRLIYLEKCLHGVQDYDTILFPQPDAAIKYPALMKLLTDEYGISQFDIHKLNVECGEYSTYGHIMQDPETNLAGTKMIFIEMHRLGMRRWGLNYHSLLYYELLWGTFFSGGFHPVSAEKWHDDVSASDFTWVNQTWYLESELELYESTWTDDFPMTRTAADDLTRGDEFSKLWPGYKVAKQEL